MIVDRLRDQSSNLARRAGTALIRFAVGISLELPGAALTLETTVAGAIDRQWSRCRESVRTSDRCPCRSMS
jgi:hypothetical protein